jgi:hypothetical protein
MTLRKIVTWKPAIDVALQQLVELSCCSNAELYSTGVRLGLIDQKEVKSQSFQNHVEKQQWRQQVTSRHKGKQIGVPAATPDLSGCRLGSSARIKFSVRLIPITINTRVDKKNTSVVGVQTGRKKDWAFGVLGVVQELCSGLIRAEILLNDAKEKNDIHALSQDKLVDFIAKSIALPALKCAAVHFPSVVYDDAIPLGAPGLICAWLGANQDSSTKASIDSEFESLVQKVIKKASWGPMSHKIKPVPSVFHMDFPPQQVTTLLDLQKPCGKSWAAPALARQLHKRLDDHNTNVAPDSSSISPVLKIWIARLCFSPSVRDDETKQLAALATLIKEVCYKKPITRREIAYLQDIGIRHLHAHSYSTTK